MTRDSVNIKITVLTIIPQVIVEVIVKTKNVFLGIKLFVDIKKTAIIM